MLFFEELIETQSRRGNPKALIPAQSALRVAGLV